MMFCTPRRRARRFASPSGVLQLSGSLDRDWRYSEGREWGVGSWSLNLRFWGALIFSPEAPKPFLWRVSERFGANISDTPNADPTTTDLTPHSRPSEIFKHQRFPEWSWRSFRRNLEGDFRASFAGESRQTHFPPKLHRQFHHQTSLRASGLWRPSEIPFKSKLLPTVLLLLITYFPQITVTVTILKFGWISITVTFLGSAVTPSFPLIPNYRLESHLNQFSQNYRYRYRLEMFLKGNNFEYDSIGAAIGL